MTKTKNFWKKQVSGPERAFLFEALSSEYGRSLFVPLLFSAILVATGFLFPSDVYFGISVHILDAVVFPASVAAFLLGKLFTRISNGTLRNWTIWILAGIFSAVTPTIVLFILTSQYSAKFSGQLPFGLFTYSLLVAVVAIISSGFRLSRARFKKLKEHKVLLGAIRDELEQQISLMRGEIKLNVDKELAKALDVLNEGKSSKELAEKLFGAIDEVIRPLSHRLAGLGLQVHPPRPMAQLSEMEPNRKGVSLARLVAPEIYFLSFAVFILPASFLVHGAVGVVTAFTLMFAQVAVLWLLQKYAKGLYVERVLAMFALALLATVFGAIYPLVVNAGYDSGISVGFVTTSLAVTGLMALVSKRLDDLNQLAIVNSEMQGVVAVLRQEAWVTKNQLAKAIHGSVQAKFLAVALRIANAPKLSDADLEAARKDIESSLDDVAISLEGRTDSFAKQFKTITDAWDGVAKIKLKADKETIALINRFPVARTCVLEVIGEAVANAAKHSKAPSMDIELQENSLGQLAVSVWSAGKLSDQPSRKGYGSQMLDEVTSGWSLTNFKGRIYLRAIVQLAK
jgi:signal transduction histidine kinase